MTQGAEIRAADIKTSDGPPDRMVRVKNTGLVAVYGGPSKTLPEVMLKPGDEITVNRYWKWWVPQGEIQLVF